jgi:hypothetical protein
VFAISPTDRTPEAFISVAGYPKWVTLFFLNGAKLKDPKKLLKGSGVRVRHVVLRSADDLDEDAISAFIDQAAAKVEWAETKGSTIIKSVSAKQRPRKPR